ncbi:MAG: alpha/beta fold hydrolase [Gaiellaceae bacterium]
MGGALQREAVGGGRGRARGGALTVVFLHAFPLDERMWPGDATAPRLYGLGRTMVEWAEAVLEAYPGHLVLVGASMGGYAALAAARRAPERIAGLLLAGSRPEPDTAERRTKRAETIALARERGAEGVWAAMRPSLFHDDSDPEVVERARVLALERTEQELVTAVEAIRDRIDSSDVYRALGERALTVVGDRDPFVPVEDARAFEPDAVVLPECAHLPSLERPAEFNLLLDEALARWR